MKISRIRGLLWQRVRVGPVVDCLAHREITSSLLAKLRKKSRSLSHLKFMLVPRLGGGREERQPRVVHRVRAGQ